jgi:hypothetical protein
MFENEYKLQIMGSTALQGKAPKTWKPADWARYNKTLHRLTLTPREMAIHVWHGHAFTPVFTEARKEQYFKWAYHIALDFDAGDETSSLPFLMEIPGTFAWMFASFGYSTPSSTEEHPRSRVVFVLDFPILSPDEYRAAYAAVAWRMAEEGSATDPACKDPLRLYYGSPKCKVSANWSVLSERSLAVLLDEYREAHPPQPYTTPRRVWPWNRTPSVSGTSWPKSASASAWPRKMKGIRRSSEWPGLAAATWHRAHWMRRPSLPNYPRRRWPGPGPMTRPKSSASSSTASPTAKARRSSSPPRRR